MHYNPRCITPALLWLNWPALHQVSLAEWTLWRPVVLWYTPLFFPVLQVLWCCLGILGFLLYYVSSCVVCLWFMDISTFAVGTMLILMVRPATPKTCRWLPFIRDCCSVPSYGHSWGYMFLDCFQCRSIAIRDFISVYVRPRFVTYVQYHSVWHKGAANRLVSKLRG